MKKEIFETPSGHQGMRVDFGTYSIEMFKSVENAANKIDYKIGYTTYQTPFCFLIDWDNDEDGGRIQLHQRDRWGSEMIFIHYEPTSLKGMFDFIGLGYQIPIM